MYQISSVKPEWRQGTRCSLLVEAVDSLGRTCTRQVEGAAFSDGPSGLGWAAFP